jgi:DNA-binding transcriptional LysR family regulator
VVVSVDDLACLDVLLWLQTGGAASERLGFSQSTISRRVQRVADLLRLEILKEDGVWEVVGDTTILGLERVVHQQYRWVRDLPLRIEAQHASVLPNCECLPGGWLMGNLDFLGISTPLNLLRDGMIDAWIACFPDVPDEHDADVVCFHLTRTPAQLIAAEGHPVLRSADRSTLNGARQYPVLALAADASPGVSAGLEELGLRSVVSRISRYQFDRWEGRILRDLLLGYASAYAIDQSDLPIVSLPIALPWEFGDTLVVKRAFASNVRFQELLNYLQGQGFNPIARISAGSCLRTGVIGWPQ